MAWNNYCIAIIVPGKWVSMRLNPFSTIKDCAKEIGYIYNLTHYFPFSSVQILFVQKLFSRFNS